MLLSTKQGIVDLDQIIHLSAVDDKCKLLSDGLEIRLYEPEDKLLAIYLYSCGALTGDNILELAEQIQVIRSREEESKSNELTIADLLTIGIIEPQGG